ncbi:LLM class flavin-dependent oxidoreductase [Streptomyces sp. NPDC091271]|uniref:LLM class flavin-dependent oxidoreductase n=1 Tax=Streptomyces sp. NPDC091271 TaxID=3365980 RepID=UPI0037F8980B
MHISVFMGPMAYSPEQDRPLIDLCVEQSIRCADQGFAMVTFGEQHFNGYEPYSNPLLMAARLAPHLGETYFGTTIVPLVLHHPLRLAEDSNLVDLLLRGRFLLGMSAGRVGFSPDFENFGLDPRRRDEIFASKLDLLRRAQRQCAGRPPIVMDTDWDHGSLTGRIMPVSYRRDGAQLAIGTNTPAKVLDAARRGFPVFLGPCPPSEAAELLAQHRAELERSGHDAAVIDDVTRKSLVTRHIFVGSSEDEAWDMAEAMAGRVPMLDRKADPRPLRELASVPPEAWERDPFPAHTRWVASWILAGTPEQVTDRIRAYDRLGVRHLNVRFLVGPYQPELANRSFDLFAKHVLPDIDNELFPPLRPAQIAAEHQLADPTL